MIIRSQDKKNIINFQQVTNLCIHPNHDYSNFRVIVCYPFSDNEDYAHEAIGTYSTEEKAIKVLDKIVNTYVGTLWTDEKRIIANRICFEMPQDSEV